MVIYFTCYETLHAILDIFSGTRTVLSWAKAVIARTYLGLVTVKKKFCKFNMYTWLHNSYRPIPWQTLCIFQQQEEVVIDWIGLFILETVWRLDEKFLHTFGYFSHLLTLHNYHSVHVLWGIINIYIWFHPVCFVLLKNNCRIPRAKCKCALFLQ